MVFISESLLKKRAEHNDGMLPNLEEIALHQEDIESLINLDKFCRHIKILLLQNNLIDRIDHISKLKELEYLNLALNNIDTIENLEGCESLNKLDMTCNFISAHTLLTSSLNIKRCPSLREIYMTGNPCVDFPKFRTILIAPNDHLLSIDGKEVLPSERITAKQNFELTCEELEIFIKDLDEKQQSLSPEEREKQYSKATRIAMHEETRKEKTENEKAPEKITKSSMFTKTGEMRQCNEGKYDFKLEEYEDPEFSTFKIQLPKYLDTTLIDVKVFPEFVSVRVKDKLTQVKLWEEVHAEPVSLQRSKVTGELIITLKKIKYNRLLIPKQKTEERKAAEKKTTSEIKHSEDDKEDEVPELE